MKFLVFGDLVGSKNVLQNIASMDLSPYDFLLFSGDVMPMDYFKKRGKKRVEKSMDKKVKLSGDIEKDKEYQKYIKIEQVKAGKLNKEFTKINKKKKIYGIWGNADHPVIVKPIISSKNINLLHNKTIKINNYYLVGYGGRPEYIFETKPNNACHSFKEKEIYNSLSKILKKLDRKKTILITHVPPYKILDQVVPEYRKYGIGTYGQKAKNGHVGSISLRKIVNKYKPSLHIFGHIHESKGAKKILDTTFINTGSAGDENEVVEIELNNAKLPKIKFKKF